MNFLPIAQRLPLKTEPSASIRRKRLEIELLGNRLLMPVIEGQLSIPGELYIKYEPELCNC